jgi:hypothetical protein
MAKTRQLRNVVPQRPEPQVAEVLMHARVDPPTVMHPTAHVGGEDGRRWREHIENQRARARHMRETRWTRENEALFGEFNDYKTIHPEATPWAIVRALRPKATTSEIWNLIRRLKRAGLLGT